MYTSQWESSHFVWPFKNGRSYNFVHGKENKERVKFYLGFK